MADWRSIPDLLPMGRITTAVWWLTVALLVMQVVQAAVYQTFNPVGVPGQADYEGGIRGLLVYFGLVFLAAAVSIPQLVFALVWMYRASENVTRRGITDRRWGPAWAVGAWFIPVANIVLGFLVIREIWWGSRPGATNADWRTPMPGWIVVWWVFYAAFNVVSYISSGMVLVESVARAFQGPDAVPTAPLALTWVSVGCYVIAGLFFLRFLREVERSEEAMPALP